MTGHILAFFDCWISISCAYRILHVRGMHDTFRLSASWHIRLPSSMTYLQQNSIHSSSYATLTDVKPQRCLCLYLKIDLHQADPPDQLVVLFSEHDMAMIDKVSAFQGCKNQTERLVTVLMHPRRRYCNSRCSPQTFHQ